MRLRVAVLLVLLAAPAYATDGLPEGLHLGPNAETTGQAKLKGGAQYKITLGGTVNMHITPGGSTNRTNTLDAFYCFTSTQEQSCRSPEAFPTIAVRSSGAPPGRSAPLPFVLKPRGVEPPVAADHVYVATFVPEFDGVATFSTTQACTQQSTSCSGPGFDIALEDACEATARTAAVNEVRAVAVQPGVAVHKVGTPESDWVPLCKDGVLQQGDEISCDPDGAVTLQFADNSTVVVKNTTQLKIASFFTEGGVVKTEILLKMGEVAAKVHKSEATKSDFRLKTGGQHAGSVRGTDFTTFYDPGSKTSLWTVREGVVAVTDGRSAKETMVGAGKEVEVTPAGVGKVAAIGKAGARRGGLSRRSALAKVAAVVAKGNGPCKTSTRRGNAVAIKPAPGGWAVSVKLTGKLKGTSKWTVKGKRVRAVNALAKQLRKRCA
jgi:hypothetical protein